MRKRLVASGLGAMCLFGCSPSEPPREAAKPITTTPTNTVPDVKATKPTQSDPKALELVNAVVLAHTESEPARLERLKKVKIHRTGEFNLGEGKSNTTMDVWVWGDQYRATYTIESRGNQPHTFSIRGNESGWQFSTAMGIKYPQPLDATGLDMTLPDVRGDRFLLLTPLVDNNMIAMVASESERESIVRVWQGNQPPMLLHIDGKTKRLVRLTYESREFGQTTTRSLTLSDHAAVAGVLLPKRVDFGLGSVTQTNWTKIEYEIPGQFEIGIFDKP